MVPLFRHFGHLNYTTFHAELIATFFPFFGRLCKGYRDIVNIALHISLKNFEQQCNGINIHVA